MTDIDRIADRTGAEIARAYQLGETDPVAVTECLLDRIDKGKTDNVFITVTRERALAEARASAARYRSKAPLSPLDGIAIAWKDLVDIAGTRTTAGSKYFGNGPIKAEDQICVRRAAMAGMVTLGKLNLSELAYSALGLNPHYGTPRNPRDATTLRSPGGSSSGCGAAVAGHLVPCAIGTDTGGSVRIPAAFNGVTGYKTSRGRIDTSGLIALARSYDTIGPLARSIEDCILLDQVLRAARGSKVEQSSLRDTSVLVPRDLGDENTHSSVIANFERALELLARSGVRIRRERLDLFDEIQDLTARCGTLTAAEAYHEYKSIVESDNVHLFDRRIIDRILIGRSMSADDVLTIQRARQRLIPKLCEILDGAFLAMPTCPITAPEVAPLEADDVLFHATNLLAVRNTMLANIFDLCAVAMPNGVDAAGLPTSLQIAAPHGADESLLATALAIERVLAAAGI